VKLIGDLTDPSDLIEAAKPNIMIAVQGTSTYNFRGRWPSASVSFTLPYGTSLRLNMNSPIREFYRLEKPDSEGRMLEEYWEWDTDTLEHRHDFIQWMFPLSEPSSVNSDAPLVTQEDQHAFRNEPLLRSSMVRSLKVFLNFLGLEMDHDGQVVRHEQFDLRIGVWNHPNHNWLRITRILKSLRLLGFDAEAKAMWKCLRELHEEGFVSENSFRYWSEAAA
jgi:hypothetical protein